jgi:hypothetical protein
MEEEFADLKKKNIIKFYEHPKIYKKNEQV